MEEAAPEIELTGTRRHAQRFVCGLLTATAAVAMFGVLFGSVEEPGPEGPLKCAGKGDFPLFCGHERIPEWHALIGKGAGLFLVLLTAAALVLALFGARGARHGVIAGTAAMVIAFVACIALNSLAWGDFMAFRGSDECLVADLALVAMFFAGAAVLILTRVLDAAERKHLASLPPSRPHADARR